MIQHGKQDVLVQDVVLEEYVKDGEKKVVAKVRCMPLGDDPEPIISNVYITERSAGMARRAFKLMGFDVETRSLQELLDNPFLLQGNKVLVDIFNDGEFGLKCEIILAQPPGNVGALDGMLRASKKKPAPTRMPDAPGAPAASDDIPF